MIKISLDLEFYPRITRLMTVHWKEEFKRRKRRIKTNYSYHYLYSKCDIFEIRAHLTTHMSKLHMYLDRSVEMVSHYLQYVKNRIDDNSLFVKLECLEMIILELECVRREFNILAKTCLAIPSGLCGEYALKIGEVINLCKIEYGTSYNEAIDIFGHDEVDNRYNQIQIRMIKRYDNMNFEYEKLWKNGE